MVNFTVVYFFLKTIGGIIGISCLTKTFILANPGIEFAFKVKLMIMLQFAATYSCLGNSYLHTLSINEWSVCEIGTTVIKENKKIVITRSILVRPIKGLFGLMVPLN